VSLPSRPPRLFRQCWPVVWLAGRLVPAAQREDWYGRRRHEIWHWAAFLEESGRVTARTQFELVRHCWHAFADALWTRFDRDRTVQRAGNSVRAPWFAAALIGIALAVLAVVTSGFERTRMLLLPLPVPASQQVSTLHYVGEWWSLILSAVPAEWVEIWQRNSQRVASMSEYSLEQRTVFGSGLQTEIGVARVSQDFFDVAEAKPALGAFFHATDQPCDCVVLSYGFWKHELHGNPNAVGTLLDLDGEHLRVVGVAPERFWIPARGVSAWQSVPMPALNLRARSLWLVGAVVRLNAGIDPGTAARELQQDKVKFDTLHHSWPGGSLEIESFEHQSRQLLLLYGVLLVVALLVTMVMGVWRYHPNRAAVSLRWVGYLFGKTLLLLLICALAAIEFTPQLAFAAGRVFDSSVTALSLFLCLALSVAALLWSLYDQRQRCPICLSRLELPVQVGEPSHMLFGFGATEFVCSRGHGLLHISDSHCSWIDPEEWTGLDASWQTLFNDVPESGDVTEPEDDSE
jgi:uncharacterized membrane protein